jgi:hypothetical protein
MEKIISETEDSPQNQYAMEKIISETEDSPQNQYALDLTKALLREIDSVAKNNGSRTLVFIIRDTSTSISRNEALDKMIADLSENGIIVLDNLPIFREHSMQGEQLTFKNDGHWNSAGHKLAAEMIYRKLIEQECQALLDCTL